MTAGTDVADSARLAATEWWLPLDLAAGVVAYVVWVAGTGALLSSIAASAGVPVGPDGGAGTLAAVTVLWLALPAVVAAWRVHDRLTNIRENLDDAYRLDRPAALLVPPLALVALLVGAGAALGFPTAVLAALLPASLYLLVRTIAYSYRVYTLSHPSVTLWLLAVAVGVQAVTVLVAIAPLLGRAGVVDAALSTAGVAATLSGEVGVGAVAAPAYLVVGAAAPLVLALGYVLVQSLAAAVARVLEPQGTKRADQRYPPWLDASTAGGRVTPNRPSSGGAPSDSDTTTDADSITDADSTGDDATASEDGDDADTDADGDAADDDIDDVSHTKVFTPPGGADDALDADDDPGDPHEDADAWQSLTDDQECDSCGESFDVDTDLTFCPACGDRL